MYLIQFDTELGNYKDFTVPINQINNDNYVFKKCFQIIVVNGVTIKIQFDFDAETHYY